MPLFNTLAGKWENESLRSRSMIVSGINLLIMSAAASGASLFHR